jgi:hypothetical protein
MALMKEPSAREKKFDIRVSNSRFSHHTMTDDHTLFMLHRTREKLDRGEKPLRQVWYMRLFRA